MSRREVAIGAGAVLIASASFVEAQRYCTATAWRLHTACGYEIQDDYAVAVAKCLNVSDRDERSDCIVTRNFSLLEPGAEARKYSASGIGVFLEVNPDSGEVLQLVECNFDARCAALPLAP